MTDTMTGADVNNQAGQPQEPQDQGAPSLLDANANPDAREKQTTQPGERPSFLPEELWDAEKKTVKSDELLEAYKKEQERALGLRQKLSKGEGKAPETAEGYKIPEVEDEKAKALLDPSDPFIGALKGIAHEAGMTQEQYNVLLAKASGWLAENAQQAGQASQPKEMTEEQFNEYRQAQYKEIGENAPRVVSAVSQWREGLFRSGQINEETKKMIDAVGSTAQGIKFLNVMRSLTGGESIPTQASDVGGLPSDQEIAQAIASEAYQKGDVAIHQKVNKWLADREKAGRSALLQI